MKSFPTLYKSEKSYTDETSLIPENKNSLSTLTFKDNLQIAIDVLQDNKDIDEILHHTGNYFDKWYGIIMIPDLLYNLSVQRLTEIFTNTHYDSDKRISFVFFRDAQFVQSVCKKIYEIGGNDTPFTDPYNKLNFLKMSIRTPELEEDAVRDLRFMFQEEDNLQIKMNIADIMLLNGFHREGNHMLERIRLLERPEVSSRNIYQDSQNVHNATVNKSVLVACVRLIELMNSNDWSINQVCDKMDKIDLESRIIRPVLERIQRDLSRFSLDVENAVTKNVRNIKFNLDIIFSNLWAFIMKQGMYKEELIRILYEQLKEMKGYCSSGHLSRLISVIQGFTEDEKLVIRISKEDRLKALFEYYLTQRLAEAPDDILVKMLNPSDSGFDDWLLSLKIDDIIDIGEEELATNILQNYLQTQRYVVQNQSINLNI